MGLICLRNLERIQEEALFWGPLEGLKLLRNVENVVFEATYKNQDVVARYCDDPIKTPSMISEELHWLTHLKNHGLPVASPLANEQGQLLAQTPGGVITVFERIPQGPRPSPVSYARHLGPVVAKLHNLSLDDPQRRERPHFTQRSWVEQRRVFLKEDPRAMEVFEDLLDRCFTFDDGPLSYNLIHSDLHEGNILSHGAQGVTLIDFDDCCYQYFAYDLAVLFLSWKKVFKDQAPSMIRAFRQPYQKEARVHEAQFQQETVDLFERLRAVEMAVWRMQKGLHCSEES